MHDASELLDESIPDLCHGDGDRGGLGDVCEETDERAPLLGIKRAGDERESLVRGERKGLEPCHFGAQRLEGLARLEPTVRIEGDVVVSARLVR